MKILRILLFFGLLLIIALAGFLIKNRHNEENRPNVILIVCDTLRADHLSIYGHQKDTSRNIDLLAQDAVLFKNAYAQAPATNPSMFNIVTSRYKTALL